MSYEYHFKKLPDSSKVLYYFAFRPAVFGSSCPSVSLLTFGLVSLFNFSNPGGLEYYLIAVFISISLTIHDV